MPRVDLGVNVQSELAQELADLGYPLTELPTYVRRISIYFFILLARDIKDGRTGWPVDTGLSRRGFYARSDGLYNHAPYVNYVDAGLDALDSYIRGNLSSLVQRAIRLSGLPARGIRDEGRGFDRFQRLVQQRRRFRGLARVAAYRRLFRPGRFLDGG